MHRGILDLYVVPKLPYGRCGSRVALICATSSFVGTSWKGAKVLIALTVAEEHTLDRVSAAETIAWDAVDETGHVRQPIRRIAAPVEAFAVPSTVCVGKMREVADSGRRGRAHVARVDVDEGRELLVGGCAVQRLADPSERAAVEVDAIV